MYEIILFFRDDYTYTVKCFNSLQEAEEYFSLMAKEMKHEECPISSVQLYSNHQKIKEC